MNIFSENKDLYSTVFTTLKNMGVKVPKIKNIKSSMPKHDKSTLQLDKQMFGVSLFKQEWTQASDNPLPKFLAISTEYLVKFSTTVGLFRKSGSISRQRSLKTKLKNGESLEGSNPNDVASLLKQWLRELPEPLIPYCLHDLFVRCQQLEGETRVTACLLSCLLLPPEHFYSLKHLLCFLKNFAKHSSINKMDEPNLAIIMAPNIFTSKTESVSKTCNSLVQLHTSVIELLIRNAECVGEVPQSVSLHSSNLDGKRDSEHESSAEILDLGSSKSNRKLMARPVQDLFSGIRKLVGQSTLTAPNEIMLTSETSWISPQITCRPVLLNDAGEIFSTPKDKESQVLGIKSKTNRIRRKSFGLLRRKDKKRKKSNRTSSQTKRDLAISRSSNLISEVPTDTMNKTFKVITSPMVSEEKSPAVQFEDNESNYENIEMSTSVCNLAISSKDSSNLSTPKSSLNFSQDSPYVSLYWSRSNKNVKNEPLETWQSECLYTDVESQINGSNSISESKGLATKPDRFSDPRLAYLNHNSITDSCSEQKHSSNNGTLPTDNNPQIYNFEDIALGKVCCDESKTQTQKLNNQRNIDPKTKANLYQTNLKKDIGNNCKSKPTSENSVNSRNPSKKDSREAENNVHYSTKMHQEKHVSKSKNKEKNSAHPTKSIEVGLKNNNEKCVNVHRSKSFLVDSYRKPEGKGKSNLNTKVAKKTTRQSSLVRGKPNSIKSGLPCHHLDKIPILKQSLETNKSKTINNNKSNTTSLENSPCRDIPENEKFFSEDDISFILNFANLNLSPLGANDTSVRNSESRPISVAKKSPTPDTDTLTLNKEPLPLPLCLKNGLEASDSKIPRLKHTLHTSPKRLSGILPDCKIETPKLRSSNSVRSTGHSKIPVLSKKLYSSDLETSFNDSCFLTPDKTLFYSPNSITWMSGSKYLSMHSPQEDSFNKRESIAFILKNKSGHVQEKVQVYDSQDSKSCSTPVIRENNNKKVPPLQLSPFRSSQSISIQNNHKTVSVSQSCNTCTKKTNLKSKNRTSLKLSSHPSKSSINSETLSPNSIPKLKEVTNFNFDGKQIQSHNSTPVKDDNYSQKSTATTQQKICNTNSSKLKLKRNSFSGQTPSKFSKKVSRSESSPSCPRPGNRLLKLRQESIFNSPNVPLDVHNSSFLPISNKLVKNSGSSLSIQKLKSDEMIDEWQYEF